MNKTYKILFLLKHLNISFFIILLSSCKPFYNTIYKKPSLVDYKLSKRAKKLHKKLFYISKKGFAIGHQDATSYGVGWTHADFPNIIKSDVNDVAGDFPAIYGFDISKIELDSKINIDSVPFNTMRELIINAYSKGGIITISWHADNPVTNGNSWDKTPAVKEILNNKTFTLKYESWLDKVTVFLKSLKYRGQKVPVIFRPFHEMNGSWFWWGHPNCTAEDYIKLWQKTVFYLRDKHHLHNLIYAYSPNGLAPNDKYLTYYPGDEFVDILGIDIYDFKNSENYIKSVVNDLKTVKDIADKKNKLYAFTETGQEGITTDNWYTKILYPNIKDTGIAWVLFWRNYTKKHHFMPYKNDHNAEDFKAFKKLPKTLFLKDINHLKF